MKSLIWTFPAYLGCLASAHASDAPVHRSLLQAEECMVRVLTKTPGVKLIAWHKPHEPLSAGSNPFIEYTFSGHNIVFDVQVSDGKFLFMAALPTGVFTPGDVTPHDINWGTAGLEKKWKVSCGAMAITITV